MVPSAQEPRWAPKVCLALAPLLVAAPHHLPWPRSPQPANLDSWRVSGPGPQTWKGLKKHPGAQDYVCMCVCVAVMTSQGCVIS